MGLYPRYARSLLQDRGAFFAAHTGDGRVVGLATARIADEPSAGRIRQIDGFVHQRFAAAWPGLIEIACACACNQEASTLQAVIAVEDGTKQAIFKALGFAYVGPHQDFAEKRLATWQMVTKSFSLTFRSP